MHISSAGHARLWFYSRDCDIRLWGAVRVQTWRLSAVFSYLHPTFNGCCMPLNSPIFWQSRSYSVAQTLDYIEVAQRRHPADRILDQLTLKLIERKVVAYISPLVWNFSPPAYGWQLWHYAIFFIVTVNYHRTKSNRKHLINSMIIHTAHLKSSLTHTAVILSEVHARNHTRSDVLMNDNKLAV